MKFKIGDKVKVTGCVRKYFNQNNGVIFKNKKGKIIALNAKNRYLVEFETKIGSHNLYGIGKNGYCFMLDEDSIKKGGEFDMSKPSLLKQLLDSDLKIIAKEVMDEEGNLNMNDPRVQEALLKTDGFKTELVKILKDEKYSSKKKNKDEQD
jgi:hypothetical protein